MNKILVIGFLAVFVFCFVYFLSGKIEISNNKKKKITFDFKKLSIKRKRLYILPLVFLLSVILLANVIFALILCILCVYFDWYVNDKKQRQRSDLIDKQVVEALTTIKNAVQAGRSLQNAIIDAKNELEDPIKSEFEKISASISLGMSFDKTLEEVSQRAKSKEFKLMLNTIRISKDTGAGLKNIFDRIIDSTSQRIAIQLKINALTAQGRMSGNIVSVIPFIVVFMMYVIEPDMIKSLFVTLPGNILLLIVVIMVLTGSFVIRKMTEIDF